MNRFQFLVHNKPLYNVQCPLKYNWSTRLLWSYVEWMWESYPNFDWLLNWSIWKLHDSEDYKIYLTFTCPQLNSKFKCTAEKTNWVQNCHKMSGQGWFIFVSTVKDRDNKISTWHRNTSYPPRSWSNADVQHHFTNFHFTSQLSSNFQAESNDHTHADWLLKPKAQANEATSPPSLINKATIVHRSRLDSQATRTTPLTRIDLTNAKNHTHPRLSFDKIFLIHFFPSQNSTREPSRKKKNRYDFLTKKKNKTTETSWVTNALSDKPR